jgi:O-antigen/teichoic acid export membrane protein
LIAQKRLDNRTIIVYTFVRYVGLAVLLIKGILLAAFLGPTLFGVWGFLTLLLQYLTYSNLGIQHTVTVELSNKATIDTEENVQLTANALGFSVLLCSVIVALGWFIQANNLSLFEKYDVAQYMFPISLIVGLGHITVLLVSICRAYKAIYRIAVFQLLDAVIPLTVLLFVTKDNAISWLLVSMIVTQVIGLLIFLVNAPWKPSIAFNIPVIVNLLMVGIPLLIYNASFNMITMIGRTILAGFYSVEAMGYYSLANSLTSAALLGLRSVSFIILPDIINQTHSGLSNAQALKVATKSNNLFGTSAYLLAFGLILVLPYLLIFAPAYLPAQKTIGALMLAQAMLAVSFGYNAAALARSRQAQVAKISIYSVVLVGVVSLVFAYFQADIFFVAVAVWLGATLFSWLQSQLSLGLLKGDTTLADLLGNRLLIAGFVSSVIFIVVNYWDLELLASLLSTITFMVINWENVLSLAKLIYSLRAR